MMKQSQQKKRLPSVARGRSLNSGTKNKSPPGMTAAAMVHRCAVCMFYLALPR